MRPASAAERDVVWRAMRSCGWIATEDEVMASNHGQLALETLRALTDVVCWLCAIGRAVTASNIRARAERIYPSLPFFRFDEMLGFLLFDDRATIHWQSMVKTDSFPHECDRCGAAAFVSFNLVHCKAGCR